MRILAWSAVHLEVMKIILPDEVIDVDRDSLTGWYLTPFLEHLVSNQWLVLQPVPIRVAETHRQPAGSR